MALKCKLWHIKNRVPHRRHLLWSRGLGNERQMGTLRFLGRSQCCCFTHLSLGLACSPGWPQTCICYFSYCCDQIPGGSNSRARGYSAHSLREHKSIMAGKHSRVHGGRKWGWEFSGFAIPLNTISRWYGSQMRPSIPFILAFEPYMCPLDTMHQRFQNPLTVLPAGDQLKHTSLWGHFMSKPLQYPRLALSF